MSSAALVQRLRDHATIGNAPVWELEWLAGHGKLLSLEKDDVIARPGERIDHLYVVLSGLVAHHLERPYGLRKVMEWHGGDVTGLLPYSRMSTADGTTAAVEATEAVVLAREWIRDLPVACPELTAILVHVMLDRARHFTSADLHDQRTLALGKVAAGLAHELNNPASALIRSAKTLVETLDGQRGAGAGGGLAGLDDTGLEALDRLYQACCEEPDPAWDPVDRADREEAIEAWLHEAGAAGNGAGDAAGILADTAIRLDALFELAGAVPEDARAGALASVASVISAGRLAREIEDGASRVFHLVSAVKRFTHLDQAMVLEAVNLQSGLEDAITLLAEKAREAGVDVRLQPCEMPEVRGVVEELNQVWHSLLDNAVDAAAPGGSVVVTTGVDPASVWVEVRDSGPGIPEAIRDRIFDPFFTTKPVGGGVGLGLELVRRVVDQHKGEIDLDTGPEGTAFRVTLPALPD